MDSELCQDIVAIQQLLGRYCFAVDKGTADDIAALFHENAVLIPTYVAEPAVKGRAAIRAWWAEYHRKNHASADQMWHHVSNIPVIEVSGNEATGRTYLTAGAVPKGTGKAFWVTGEWRDKYVKEGGRWLFKERELIVDYTTESNLLAKLPGT